MSSRVLTYYRNSADHQESTFNLGQITLAISGLNQTFIENNFRKDSQGNSVISL
jgi:hypothetical protein